MKTMDAVMKVVAGIGLTCGAGCFALLGWWIAVPLVFVGLAQIGFGIGAVIAAQG